jgi:hypothetical protein
MNEKKAMTLSLTTPEMEALEHLARRKDVSKTAVVRQALRLMHLVDERVTQGTRLVLEDDTRQQKSELVVL